MVRLWSLLRRLLFQVEFYLRWKLRRFCNRKHTVIPLTLLIQFRNEADNLPGFFANACPQVSHIIALDDGSSDASATIAAAVSNLSLISKPPVTPHHWDEPGNKRLLINEALLKAPCWILVLDADERLEQHFHERANLAIHLAMRYRFSSIALRFGELWADISQVRIDGIWGKKRRACLFLLQHDYQLQSADFHAGWNCANKNTSEHVVSADICFYHLGMLTAAQRESRKLKYKQLDPDNQWQSIGYDYLTDLHGLTLKKTPADRNFLE